MLPTLAVGWRASALRGEEAERFREVAAMTIDVAARRSVADASLNHDYSLSSLS